MDIRQTLGGDYVIYDHPDIDIVIMPKLKKVVAFPKDKISELTYDTESKYRLIILTRRSARDSVQGGNVYASLQGLFETPVQPKTKQRQKRHLLSLLNPLQPVLFSIAEFIEDERPRSEYEEDGRGRRRFITLSQQRDSATGLEAEVSTR